MKLFATDYDGTLLYGQHIMQEDLQAIDRWKEKGNLFAIVTGRSYESIAVQIKKYSLPCDYVVTNNGGMVFDAKGNELFASYLDYMVSIDILYAVKMMDGVASYVVNDGINRHRIVVNDQVQDQRYPSLEPDFSEQQILEMGQFAQIVISMADADMAIEMADMINMFFSEHVVAYANNFVVDVVPAGVSKATGLDFVCEYANISQEDTYTIGDSYNDIPLMEYGQNGACMVTAVDEVKEHASHIYSSIKEMLETI